MGEPQQKCLFSLVLTTLAILSTLHYLQVQQNEGHNGAERERIHLSDVFISLKTTACLISCDFFLFSKFIFQIIPSFRVSDCFLLLCCVGYELHFFVNFCKIKKKVKWAYQRICLLRKITPHTFPCYWKPGCQLLDLPFTSSPTPSRPRIWETKYLPSALRL